MDDIKLNLGCGSVRPSGWINTDSSLNANLQRLPIVGRLIPGLFKSVKYDSGNMIYMNLNRKWRKYKDATVDVVYASHLFEHLSLNSASLFLRESFRCLKPGGVIRLVVPDLYKICKQYIRQYENGDSNPSEYIMWAINMNREGQYGSNIGMFRKVVLEWQGYPHQHKFMYDEKSLSMKIKDVGFNDVHSLSYGESEFITEIKDVEGLKESYLSIYIEARKPGLGSL